MPKQGPKWQPADYTQFYLLDEPTHTTAEIRREYGRMRDLLVKRAARLEQAGLDVQARYIREQLPTLKEIKQQPRAMTGRGPAKREMALNEEIANRLAQARSIEQERGYSIKGIKEIQQSIQEETGEVVPLGDVLSFNQYMASWRTSAFYKTLVGSGEAAGYHSNEYQDIGGSFTDFYTLYQQEVMSGVI